VAVSRGFKHFRVTGGEPLVRRDVTHFLRELIRLRGVETVQLSTNGTRLAELGEELYASGLRRLNISLDALHPARYHAITRGDVAPVLEGIRHAKSTKSGRWSSSPRRWIFRSASSNSCRSASRKC
jgi:GTP 3',8-cyclase